MAELTREVRLYLVLRAASIRGALQYRGNIAIMVLAGFAYQGSGFAFVWVLMHTFGTVAGWGLGDMAFLYGMRLLSHAVWLLLLDGVTHSDQSIRDGQFERMLLRPANTMSLLATNTRSLMSFGDLTVGVLVFGIAVTVADVDWSPLAMLFAVLAILGGALIEASVSVAIAGVSIRIIDTWAFRMVGYDAVDKLSSYPLGIFGNGAQKLLTYAFPFAFIAFLPANLLLGHDGDLAVPAWLGYLAPLVGIALFTLAYRFFHRQLRHFQGVGH
ncbi:ABC-2 family transporter protein [Actinoplanes sp. NPDC051851]|uniref:ABC transporter permease n=1 Tax=Actinoplanes sp. NPDC051851 TaxID=3154753 RepID=UPI00342C57F2